MISSSLKIPNLEYPGDDFEDTKYDKFNKLVRGDCKVIMEEMLDKGWKEKIDLIYIDPPFFSGENYEVIWGDKQEHRFFEDMHWDNIKSYIKIMKERVNLMYDLLKPTGSFYFHCDWHAGHYIKVMLDEIFGYNNFRNEIIWHYTGGGRSKHYFSRKHDSIFMYVKTNNKHNIFNLDDIRVPYKETSGYAQGGITSKSGKKYFPNPKGTPVDDVWDIPIINPLAKERLGYPTQKPEALLERIIKASSNKGEIVLDPFCGCGTSVAVASRLGRRFVGIDLTPTAIKLVNRQRLNPPLDDDGNRDEEDGKRQMKINLNYEVVNMPTTTTELSKITDYEFQQWVCDMMLAKNTNPNAGRKRSGADKGVDGIVSDKQADEFNGALIEVKQSEGIGRPIVQKLRGAMASKGIKHGFIIAFSFADTAKKEVDRYLRMGDSFICLINVRDLLRHEDNEHFDYSRGNNKLYKKFDKYTETSEE